MPAVVNCFQIVSLTLKPQQGNGHPACHHGCELLSDCIFAIETTAWKYENG